MMPDQASDQAQNSLSQRLRESAKVLADFADQDEPPTLTVFGINLLHSAISTAIERIEADQSSLNARAGRIEALADALDAASKLIRFASVRDWVSGEERDAAPVLKVIDAALRGEQP
jgi:hypothetical protein